MSLPTSSSFRIMSLPTSSSFPIVFIIDVMLLTVYNVNYDFQKLQSERKGGSSKGTWITMNERKRTTVYTISKEHIKVE